MQKGSQLQHTVCRQMDLNELCLFYFDNLYVGVCAMYICMSVCLHMSVDMYVNPCLCADSLCTIPQSINQSIIMYPKLATTEHNCGVEWHTVPTRFS